MSDWKRLQRALRGSGRVLRAGAVASMLSTVTGCASSAHRDGEYTTLICFFACMLRQADGNVDLKTGMGTPPEDDTNEEG